MMFSCTSFTAAMIPWAAVPDQVAATVDAWNHIFTYSPWKEMLVAAEATDYAALKRLIRTNLIATRSLTGSSPAASPATLAPVSATPSVLPAAATSEPASPLRLAPTSSTPLWSPGPTLADSPHPDTAPLPVPVEEVKSGAQQQGRGRGRQNQNRGIGKPNNRSERAKK